MYPAKKLSEICEIVNWWTPDTWNSSYWDGDILWITPKDMWKLEDIYVSDTFRKITEQWLKNSSTKLFPQNSIILSSRAPIWHLAINTVPMCTNQGCKWLISWKDLDAKYLYYFLLNSVDLLNSLWTGTTFKELSSTKLKEIQIPLPPLSTQTSIVARLDSAMAEIDEARRQTESALASAREVWESTLESVFAGGEEGWEEKTFDEVCEISSKLIDPKEKQYQELLHIWWANIESVTGKLLDLKTAKEEKLISGKFLFDENIVLYSKIRPYLIKVARPDFEGLCSADIYPLSPKKNLLHKDFLYYLLISASFTEYAIKWSARAGMPKVNREHLFAYTFNLPSLPEQSRIVAHLDAVRAETESLERLYTEKLASLDELRRSVLEEAFS